MRSGHRSGVLLVNLGTPGAPDAGAVRRYLREFLMDPRVLDIGFVARFLLVQLYIAPFRAPRSAAAYAKVWTERGSPLLVHGRDLTEALTRVLGETPAVLAMRYGVPTIREGMRTLADAGVEHVVVVPLYPQYAVSSTGSTLARVMELAANEHAIPSLSIVPPFYADDGFVAAFSQRAREVIGRDAPDHVLFSFHGLPERQVRKTDPSGRHCLAAPDCCERADARLGGQCYRAQCVSTATRMAETLGLARERWSISFQSRLGRTKWIEPYTDEVLPALAKRGVRRLAVVCPSFVADCLETLEEIQIRAREEFLAAGGEALTLVPSLNVTPAWVEALRAIVERHLDRTSTRAPQA